MTHVCACVSYEPRSEIAMQGSHDHTYRTYHEYLCHNHVLTAPEVGCGDHCALAWADQ